MMMRIISTRKRMRSISKRKKTHKSNNNCRMDRISCMPDEILVSVLSLLGIREAARTCVLSKRWEHLWSFNRVLNFDASQTVFQIESNPEALLGVERCRYINWVNKVVESHCGSTIDEFRVCFCLNSSSSCVIDRWIEFAITKSVQRLEMELEPSLCCDEHAGLPYTITNRSYNILFKSPACLSSIRSLRSLCFSRVNISGEILERFLSDCPLLESLRVRKSEHLVNLKVFGSSLRLKFLDISVCPNLKDLEVCATSLVSFSHSGLGQEMNMQIKDAFQLAKVSISNLFEPIRSAFFSFSSYFSQLETLSLGMEMTRGQKGNSGFRKLPEFTKLKFLTLQVIADQTASILCWTPLIYASPVLHKFKLQLEYMKPLVGEGKSRRKIPNSPHQCLKEVELAGFVGYFIDLELAHYFIKNAVMLEKITIERHSTRIMWSPRPWMFNETKEKQYAKEQAMQLQKILPAGVKMEII